MIIIDSYQVSISNYIWGQMKMKRQLYPLTAIVGQDDMKLALILNVINPSLGGVLIFGEKGTAKSTAVRSLAQLLPPMIESKDAQSLRVVELPISATEDRVVGTLDIEQAIKTGEKKFEPGILANAHKNILYVDEINLLEDHIVDVLLDAAAMGVNTIEREGISYAHPAKFVLVGTMNPEEGDLRPQLLDRFGLSVEISGESDIKKRMEILKRRIAFENNPGQFIHTYQASQIALKEKILQAQKNLPRVEVKDLIIELAAAVSISTEVEGHRSDITLIKTAMTLAAYDNRTQVTVKDIEKATYLVLPHRLKRKPFESRHFNPQSIEALIKEFQAIEV